MLRSPIVSRTWSGNGPAHLVTHQMTRRHASQQRLLTATTPSLETIHLGLHDTDPVTGP